MKSWASPSTLTLTAALIATCVIGCSKSSPNPENSVRGVKISNEGPPQATLVSAEEHNGTVIGTRTITDLASQLSNADFNNRFSAGQELFKLGSNAAPAVATIGRLLETEPDKVHDIMLRVVEHCPSQARQIEPTLEKCLKSSNVNLRITCARTLWVLDHSYADKVRPVAIRSLGEADAGVRVEAASLLWRMDHDAKEVVPTLIAQLSGSTTAYDYRAIGLLGQIGPSAKEAVPALQDWLKSGREQAAFVTNAAVAALQKIGATP